MCAEFPEIKLTVRSLLNLATRRCQEEYTIRKMLPAFKSFLYKDRAIMNIQISRTEICT